ncbi:hypothetical protein G7B40_031525 [Aetokthonos hydrillicola Thurmond2011]|jgi:hypothetical protein|uniref:Uncharacterized protein n=1 Tax=Aetokthonos hydrillicola Thurmond2011 TaxID=2712845 RepID=A0AAP5MCD2_9CYAN|nr:hypothetical protein [Aetokthonos hydrillicola]MBO3462860.1 hypothetical protein [Aetokthonos hydrillicola CCALA 1050]MBW4590973.1 hypothetical protein [Aetokthonos hydrillicola CCALA 1050]MDR9899057.1 hypothetical protein [Aetokthonos hydrillicola Thurmond2011]
MLHDKRAWTLTEIVTPEDLAKKLTSSTWTGCTGFTLGKLLFLNDATSADGAQEYAVVIKDKEGKFLQIESITFSWCSYDRALEMITALLENSTSIAIGENIPSWSTQVSPRIEPSKEHQCSWCA